jgi:E3 ubiquitin-protein ligase EDD1
MGRQLVEQRQYKSSQLRSVPPARKMPMVDADMEMPEHNLEPPRFCRKALERILTDWQAVKSMLCIGMRERVAR